MALLTLHCYHLFLLSFFPVSLFFLCMLAWTNPRIQRSSTPLPAKWKRRCTMRTMTSMRTCPHPSWLLAVLPSLPLLPLPLTVTTKPQFLKSHLSFSLLTLKLTTLLRWLTALTAVHSPCDSSFLNSCIFSAAEQSWLTQYTQTFSPFFILLLPLIRGRDTGAAP